MWNSSNALFMRIILIKPSNGPENTTKTQEMSKDSIDFCSFVLSVFLLSILKRVKLE